MNASGTSASSRAASPVAHAVGGPPTVTIASSNRARRVEILRRPGEARNAAMPARIEKSSKSPSSWICGSGSTRISRVTGTAAPRCGRRGRDRAAARPRAADRRDRRPRAAAPARAAGCRLRMRAAARAAPAASCASAAPRAARARSGPRPDSPPASFGAQRLGRRPLERASRRRARCRGGGGGCCRGSSGRTRRAAARRRRAHRR